MTDVKPREEKKRLAKSRIKPYKRRSKSAMQIKQNTGSLQNSALCFNAANNDIRDSESSAINDIRDFESSAVNDIRDSESSAVQVLKELSFNYEIICDENHTSTFFIQDKFQDRFFAYYPEFLCIDILCETPELDKSLVLFIAIDTNSHCEIVSIGLLKSVNSQGFVWICDMFKKHNPYWEKIELILSDESCDKGMLKTAFPQKLIFTSFFHSMKAFKKDLSSLDNAAVNQDVNKALLLFEKLMFVTSEAGYTEILKQMKLMNAQVFNLFKKKWQVRKDLWAVGLYTDCKIFLKAFNVYLLSIRRKLKSVISSQETLESVIRHIHTAIYKMRKEWFQHLTKMFHSPLASYIKIQAMQKFASFTTPFASVLIYEQMKKCEDIKTVQKIDTIFYYKVDGTLATSYSCCCNFYKFMKLPCSHIFAVRKHLSLPAFFQSVRPSWINANYCNTAFDLYSDYILEQEKSKADEVSRRYQEFVRTSQELWDQIFNCDENVSQERLETYQNILKSWKSEFDITIIRSEKQNDSFVNCNETLENLPTDHFKELYGISINDIIDSENNFMDVSLCSDDTLELL